jgi:hypothetical protein
MIVIWHKIAEIWVKIAYFLLHFSAKISKNHDMDPRTNSSEQRRRYNRELQKAAGFVVGMCCPFLVLLYMSFYLTWWTFHESPFRLNCFRTCIYPRSVDKMSPENHNFLLSFLESTLRQGCQMVYF